MLHQLALFAQGQTTGEFFDKNKWVIVIGGVLLLVGIFFLVDLLQLRPAVDPVLADRGQDRHPAT